ncbi:MAG: hypothetical protein IPF92_22775 [Myxococcales bacterium]|nr:hypothetical protein [Myxococcales bacterium]
MARSTRISIVEQSLQDIMERILELPRGPAAVELHRKAREIALSVAAWQRVAPSREDRQTALGRVLALNIEVINAKKAAGRSRSRLHRRALLLGGGALLAGCRPTRPASHGAAAPPPAPSAWRGPLVQSGDATSSSAVVWAKATGEDAERGGRLVVDVTRVDDPGFVRAPRHGPARHPGDRPHRAARRRRTASRRAAALSRGVRSRGARRTVAGEHDHGQDSYHRDRRP